MSMLYTEPKKRTTKKQTKAKSPKKTGNTPKRKPKAQPKAQPVKTQEQKDLEAVLRRMVRKPEAQRNKDIRAFQKSILNIMDGLKSRIYDDANLHNLFVSAPGSGKKLFTNYSLYNESKEEFTKRYLIEPLLKTLGYDDIAYQTSIGSNNKESDYCLILHGDKRVSERVLIVVEAKSMLEPLRKHRDQIIEYLQSFNSKSLFAPYIGILTDGLTWELYALLEDGHGVLWWSLNIQPIFDWAFNKADGQNPSFPEGTYRKFMTVFNKENIQLFGKCLSRNVPFMMPDDDGNPVPITRIKDKEPVKRITITYIPLDGLVSYSREL